MQIDALVPPINFRLSPDNNLKIPAMGPRNRLLFSRIRNFVGVCGCVQERGSVGAWERGSVRGGNGESAGVSEGAMVRARECEGETEGMRMLVLVRNLPVPSSHGDRTGLDGELTVPEPNASRAPAILPCACGEVGARECVWMAGNAQGSDRTAEAQRGNLDEHSAARSSPNVG